MKYLFEQISHGFHQHRPRPSATGVCFIFKINSSNSSLSGASRFYSHFILVNQSGLGQFIINYCHFQHFEEYSTVTVLEGGRAARARAAESRSPLPAVPPPPCSHHTTHSFNNLNFLVPHRVCSLWRQLEVRECERELGKQ